MPMERFHCALPSNVEDNAALDPVQVSSLSSKAVMSGADGIADLLEKFWHVEKVEISGIIWPGETEVSL